MSTIERLGLKVLHQLDPELAHGLSLCALRSGAVPLPAAVHSARLTTTVAGLPLANPVGLAAGFDKNATAIPALSKAGFGFLEVGAVTPLPQPGNPKPRLWRLSEDRAVINRFGFNNEGVEAVLPRLQARKALAAGGVPLGLNLGANKTSADRAADFAQVLRIAGPALDFATVNVSSPNTEKLRDLQGKDALSALLLGVIAVRDGLERRIPIFLKIAPDLSGSEIEEIADVALHTGIDGIVATNTTLSREGLHSADANQPGGLSGEPLFEASTRVLAQLSRATRGRIPLIGVGGVGSGLQAYEKIRAGACAVQLYSALVYEGLSLLPRILRELDGLLTRDGFSSVSEAVGSGRDRWL